VQVRVSTSASILGSLNDLIKSNRNIQKIFEHLSSGKKINWASDDPAGMVISTQMRSRIAEIQQLIDNIENMNNKYGTAEGQLATAHADLLSIRDIILASSNEAVTTEEMRQAYQNSVDNAVTSFNRTLENATYGNQALFDGSEGSVADVASLQGLDITDPENTSTALATIDTRMDEITNLRAEIGAKQKYEFASQSDNLHTEMINLTGAESSITDADIMLEFVELIREMIKNQASMVVLAHQNLMNEAVIDIFKD
jgi:flagellin